MKRNILIPILLLLIIISTIFIVRPSKPALTDSEIVKIAVDTVIAKSGYKINYECVSGTIDSKDTELANVTIREIHNNTCGGDPSTSPKLAVIVVELRTGKTHERIVE